MKTRRRNVSEEDRLTITRRSKQSKTSTNGTKNSEDSNSIPIDLIIDILSRLPARSVARCRCVSKLWASMLRCPDFTELFLTRSRTRPQLLFACIKQGDKVLFLSATQPQNLDVNSSPIVCAKRLMHFSCVAPEIIGPVHGLVCLKGRRIVKGKRETVPVICNPSTGQSLSLPKVKTRRVGVKSYLGYDPVDKQFKVLSMSYVRNRVFEEHQILTIGGSGENLSWRLIECCVPPHYSKDKGICINGVLYYLARVIESPRYSMVVCFDVRSEKFSFVTIVEDSVGRVVYSGRVAYNGNLISYNGKLGVIVSDSVVDLNRNINIELWILEDVEKKQEWSKRTYVLPALGENMGITYLHFLGMTQTNEIVFYLSRCVSFCLFYYNIQRNTITKVGIQGMEDSVVYKSLNHVEDVKLF